jgi:hypothetical protein
MSSLNTSFTLYSSPVTKISIASWPEPRLQTWRYISDRTGVLAMANLLLIWAFAMRNNVLIWLTGWSFSAFNVFHRWVARVATIKAIVHSIGYTMFSFLGRINSIIFTCDWDGNKV